jgi:NAD(P)-dependent dehydrogenase (short-subunit alcohol dehydrogenase family)
MSGPEAGSRFGGRVVLVTGAANGIGEATARRLSQEGASVVLTDLDEARLVEVAADLAGPSVAVPGDVSSEADVDRAVAVAVETFGRVDLYHVNAGIIGPFDNLTDITVDDFDRVVAVNLRGAFLGVRAAFRQYAAQGTGGAVVLTASIASLRGSHDLLPYVASKHGVLGVMRSAAMFGGPQGVRVNAVAPGLVPTRLFSSVGAQQGAGSDMTRRGTTVPLRRVGRPEEIASTVAFLLSDDAAYINGEVISVDGGAAVVNTVRPGGGAGAWSTEPVDTSSRVIHGRTASPTSRPDAPNVL